MDQDVASIVLILLIAMIALVFPGGPGTPLRNRRHLTPAMASNRA